MYAVSTEIKFKAGHYLRLFGSQAEQNHQHDWRVRVTVESENLDQDGLVMDFQELEEELRAVVQPLGKPEAINELSEFARENPSTERLACYIYDSLINKLPDEIRLCEVEVWETPDCRAIYRP
jgi:6-pyruvoyltetrahydropterin/6-carboxytetrahydropterin synthase